MDNTSRKRKHSYRLSYACEVGSSLDPDMEDIGQWEDELRGKRFVMRPFSPASKHGPIFFTGEPPNTNTTPHDRDDDELQAYAEEYAALLDFEDVNGGEWSLSDFEDIDHPLSGTTATPSEIRTGDDDMDMS
jgi:hypothetical protein